MLAYVKKLHRHSDELLHLALILSLIRVDPESYLGLGLGRSNLIRGNLHNITMGDTWAHAPSDFHRGFMSNMPDIPYLHPKSMEASLSQYQEELIEDLNDLGRYTSLLPPRGPRTITAYLLDDSSINQESSLPNVNTVSPVVAASSSSMLAIEPPQSHNAILDPIQQPSSQESGVQDDNSDLSLEVKWLNNQSPLNPQSLLSEYPSLSPCGEAGLFIQRVNGIHGSSRSKGWCECNWKQRMNWLKKKRWWQPMKPANGMSCCRFLFVIWRTRWVSIFVSATS